MRTSPAMLLLSAGVAFISFNFCEPSLALTITKGEVILTFKGKVHREEIKNDIINGKKFEFDFNTLFPNVITKSDLIKGFVFADMDANSAVLEKGLSLLHKSEDFGDGNIIATLEVEGTWANPEGNITEEESINGVLEVSPVRGTSAIVGANQSINPFLGPFETAERVNGMPGGGNIVKNVAKTKGPETEFLPAGIINFHDLISLSTTIPTGAGAGVFAKADFSDTTLERAVVTPEPTSTLSLLALGTLGAAGLLRRKRKA